MKYLELALKLRPTGCYPTIKYATTEEIAEREFVKIFGKSYEEALLDL